MVIRMVIRMVSRMIIRMVSRMVIYGYMGFWKDPIQYTVEKVPILSPWGACASNTHALHSARDEAPPMLTKLVQVVSVCWRWVPPVSACGALLLPAPLVSSSS